jgi:hypothetical protein
MDGWLYSETDGHLGWLVIHRGLTLSGFAGGICAKAKCVLGYLC